MSIAGIFFVCLLLFFLSGGLYGGSLPGHGWLFSRTYGYSLGGVALLILVVLYFTGNLHG